MIAKCPSFGVGVGVFFVFFFAQIGIGKERRV
jgi:hypothetical protein